MTTTAYIKAVADNNEILFENCNEHSKELSALLNDLENEYAKLELEKILMITKKDILDFISEITDGDIHDIDYQKFLIDRYVNSVYAYNDRIVIIFNVGNNGKKKEKITPEDIRTCLTAEPCCSAIKKCHQPRVRLMTTNGGAEVIIFAPDIPHIIINGVGGFATKYKKKIISHRDNPAYHRKRKNGRFCK